MEPKVYKLAIVAALCVATISFKSYACQSPEPLPAPVAPANPVVNLESLVSMVGPVVDDALNNYLAANNSGKRKMQRMQKQIQKLSSEITISANEAALLYSRQAEEIARDAAHDFGQQISPDFQQLLNLDQQVADGLINVKSKTYSKTYTVDDNDKLQIDNHYGNVTVNTWNKNEFKVDVEIKAYANGDSDAQKMLDKVKINDNRNNSVVAFTTVIGDNSDKGFWAILNTGSKSAVRKTVINYTIFMPAKNPVTITNSYGAVVLPDLSGKVTIKSAYSNLTSKALTNTDNTINIKYGNANMESLVGGSLQIAYGSLNLQWAANLKANISYSSARIGKLSNSAAINVNYGDGLFIGSLDKNLKNLSVNSSYAPVKIGAVTDNNVNFAVNTHLGNFSYDDGINITSQSPADNGSLNKNYKGRIGKGDSDRWIVVNSNYSNVSFDQ